MSQRQSRSQGLPVSGVIIELGTIMVFAVDVDCIQTNVMERF